MGVWLKAWSPLLSAILVVCSLFVTERKMRIHTESMQGRLTEVEKNIASIRNALEGNQGVMVRLATLDLRMGNQLQNLIVQRDNSIEQNGQEWFDIHAMHEGVQAVKNQVETILSLTQRLEYMEELLLDMQGTLEEMKKQRTKKSQ